MCGPSAHMYSASASTSSFVSPTCTEASVTNICICQLLCGSGCVWICEGEYGKCVGHRPRLMSAVSAWSPVKGIRPTRHNDPQLPQFSLLDIATRCQSLKLSCPQPARQPANSRFTRDFFATAHTASGRGKFRGILCGGQDDWWVSGTNLYTS